MVCALESSREPFLEFCGPLEDVEKPQTEPGTPANFDTARRQRESEMR
jgi:hypothetical protein